MSNKFHDCDPPILREKIRIKAGDYFEVDVFVGTNLATDEPFDITGCELVFTMANDATNPTVTLVKSTSGGGILTLNAPGGHARVILESPDTLVLGVDGGFMYYDVVMTDTNVRVFTVASGVIILLNNISTGPYFQ